MSRRTLPITGDKENIFQAIVRTIKEFFSKGCACGCTCTSCCCERCVMESVYTNNDNTVFMNPAEIIITPQ